MKKLLLGLRACGVVLLLSGCTPRVLVPLNQEGLKAQASVEERLHWYDQHAVARLNERWVAGAGLPVDPRMPPLAMSLPAYFGSQGDASSAALCRTGIGLQYGGVAAGLAGIVAIGSFAFLQSSSQSAPPSQASQEAFLVSGLAALLCAGPLAWLGNGLVHRSGEHFNENLRRAAGLAGAQAAPPVDAAPNSSNAQSEPPVPPTPKIP